MISVYTDGGFAFDFPDATLIADNKDFVQFTFDGGLRTMTMWKSRSIVGVAVSGATSGGVAPVVRP